MGSFEEGGKGKRGGAGRFPLIMFISSLYYSILPWEIITYFIVLLCKCHKI